MKFSITRTLLLVLAIFAISIPASTQGATPQIINYQGQLTNSGGDPLDTTVSIIFSIYDSPSTGGALWTETQADVLVTGGIFSVLLGSVTELSSTVFDDVPRYLGVKVGSDDELTPRVMIAASPYSYKAGSVEGFTPGPNNSKDGIFIFLGGDSNTVNSDYSSIVGGKANVIEAFNSADTTLDTSNVLNPNPINFDVNGRSTGWGAFIGGGWGNHAHGVLSVLGGGLYNTSYCGLTSLVGGYGNFAGGNFSFLGGGYRNTLGSDSLCGCGYASVIDGGFLNINDGYYAVIGGGFNNQILCTSGNTIAGGMRNRATSNYSTIGGGSGNSAGGDGATIGGGYYNYVQAMYGTISGGGNAVPSDPNTNNEVYDNYGTIGGGGDNKAGTNDGIEISDQYITIGGGHSNEATSGYTTIGGGNTNYITGDFSTIGGGDTNVIIGAHSFIGGGQAHELTASYATIAGGQNNRVPFNDHQFIGGGAFNYTPDPYGTISGGLDNQAFSYATVGGGVGNFSQNEYTFIGGGNSNLANGNSAVIGGGYRNTASGDTSVVGGGAENLASLFSTTVSGGSKNAATAQYATIGGGRGNNAFSAWGTIGGGFENSIGQGQYATVPGGYRNVASGTSCFAAGNVARSIHECSFVWSDCCIDATGTTDLPLYSTGMNTWNARATGGFYLFTSCDTLFDATAPPPGVHLPTGGSMWLAGSSRDLKENITPVNGSSLLEDISNLQIYRWNYKDQDESVQHIGPMAQDFYATFNIGDDDKTIASLDPAGISLAAIKELHMMNKSLSNKVAEIDILKEQIAKLENELDELSNVKQDLAQITALVNVLMADKNSDSSNKVELADNK